MKVLITPRGFANYGTDIVKEMEAKGVTVHYNDTGKQYTPEQFPLAGITFLPLFQKKLNLCHHAVDVIGQICQFVISFILDPYIQISVRDILTGLDHMLNRTGNTEVSVGGHGQCNAGNQDRQDQQLTGDNGASI